MNLNTGGITDPFTPWLSSIPSSLQTMLIPPLNCPYSSHPYSTSSTSTHTAIAGPCFHFLTIHPHAGTILLIYPVSMETWVVILKLWLPHFLLKSSKTEVRLSSLSIHASWFWPMIHSSFHLPVPGILCSRQASLCSVSQKCLPFLIMAPTSQGHSLRKSCGNSNVTFRSVTWLPAGRRISSFHVMEHVFLLLASLHSGLHSSALPQKGFPPLK